VANDYKQDGGKVPLLAALQPFAPALYALARMMEDMKAKHQLQGSADPFNEWAQLPEAKYRMAQAMERHLLPEDCTLWDVNHKDGGHLHATHGLFNLLGALTLHIRGSLRPADVLAGHRGPQALAAAQDAIRDKAAKPAADMAHLLDRARVELWLQGEREASPVPVCRPLESAELLRVAEYTAGELHANNPTQWAVPVTYWTGDECTWRCTCGAGSEHACTCPRVP
jgi:hypothetical protein